MPDHSWEGGRVQCPGCEKEGYTEARVNLCSCGRYFEVYDASGDRGTRIIDGPEDSEYYDT